MAKANFWVELCRQSLRNPITMTSPSFAIHLFGPLRVLIQGEPMPRVRTRSVEWLLALLVLRPGRAVDRSWLAGTLWPDSEESQALRNLREDLVRLRKALGSESVRLQSPSRDTLSLDLEAAEIDLIAFDAAMRAGDEGSLRCAIALYTGPLLEGCYAEWTTPERESREQACLTALETLAELAERRGDWTEALTLLRRAEGMDGLRDSIQRRLMQVLAASGDTPAAQMAYREHRLRLRREMNLEPDAETTRLFQQIRATGKGSTPRTEEKDQPLEAKPQPQPPAHALETSVPAPLPHPITALIGREEAVREIVRQVVVSRLVTLVGTGGVGKTRLCIQAAREAAVQFPQGAAFVTLAALSDPALLPAFVASALGIREEGSADAASLLQSLVGWLSVHEILLVLDNCEHLIEATAQLCQTLLERCPRLHILATSRQRLGLTGEVVWRVPSLPSPDPQRLPADEARLLEELMLYPAVQLFMERVRMVRSEFRLAGREDAEAVAHICQRLDGIPLAIELAAARAGVLTLSQIASRLDDRFRLLTGGSRGMLTRHQTLRALIDWSYDLLTEAEQALLLHLSVFVGGWTLEAAEQIFEWGFGVACNQKSKIEKLDVLDWLISLVDKSLVLAEAGPGGLRYRMLETIREYALERLRESGEEPAARNQHLAYCYHLAQEAGPALRGSDLEAALARVEVEVGNFRAALAWAQTEAALSDASLRLAAALWPYWEMHGSLSEGREVLRMALDRSPSSDEPERAQALLGAATLAFIQVDLSTALTFGQESLSLFRRQNDPRNLAAALILCGHACLESGAIPEAESYLLEALECSRQCDWVRGSALALMHLGLVAMQREEWEQARSLLDQGVSEAADHAPTLALSLHNRGWLAQRIGDYPSAVKLLEKSLGIWRQLGHRHKASLTLRHLGHVVRQQGDLERALFYFQEAVAACREQGNRFHLAFVLLEAGSVYYEQGDYEPARQAYAESLELFTQTGSDWGINAARMNLGSALFHLGEPVRAQQLHREALAIYHRDQNLEGIVWSLEQLGVVEAMHGEGGHAVRLLGAASTARERLERPRDRWDQEDWETAMASVREKLGEEVFVILWAEGYAWTLDEAVEQALKSYPIEQITSATTQSL